MSKEYLRTSFWAALIWLCSRHPCRVESPRAYLAAPARPYLQCGRSLSCYGACVQFTQIKLDTLAEAMAEILKYVISRHTVEATLSADVLLSFNKYYNLFVPILEMNSGYRQFRYWLALALKKRWRRLDQGVELAIVRIRVGLWTKHWARTALSWA